jgi:hypothetical protein
MQLLSPIQLAIKLSANSLTLTSGKSWFDTPSDKICKQLGTCCKNHNPPIATMRPMAYA